MSVNKHLVEEKSTLLKNKLEKISASLATGTFQTEEEVTSEVVRILNDFYRDLQEPIFVPLPISQNDLPDPDLYNKIWNTILDDLSVVFKELENLEGVTIGNFNFVSTEADRLLARLKNTSSHLGDYILYSTNPTKGAFYFKDSFNDLSRIEVNSPLLNLTQCDVDQDQGIVTLPINKEKESFIAISATPILNANSNGVPGNNQQLGANFNGDPVVILDNNPDTWFEYESVVPVTSEPLEPLILDMTINIGDEKVINYIRVNPNNFGTRTVVNIDTIETSLDGKIYINVKDDIPIGDFLTKDEENVFVLSPSTSKFAGQGIYSFTPRKAKYVHIIFRQAEPYVISTTQGDKLRYAIGIRDIDIRGYQYLPEGEFVSREYAIINDSIRKIAIDTNQNPIEESTLCAIKYFISPDNGQSWHELRPKSFSGFANFEAEVPEILDFNGSADNTIRTQVPVQSIKFKATLSRSDDAFEDGSSALKKQIQSTSELHHIPEGAPFLLALENPPVDGSISVIDPLYGSRGLEQVRYVVGTGNDSTFYLPYTKMKRVMKKVEKPFNTDPVIWQTKPAPVSDWMHVGVGAEEWATATQPLADYGADYETDVTFRRFIYEPVTAKLTFGTGLDTMKPPSDEPITVWMEAERLFPSEVQGAHKAKLDFSTSNDKTQFSIKRYAAEVSVMERLPINASIIHLDYKNITDEGTIEDTLDGLGFTNKVSFVNGVDELTAATMWSIDTANGLLYLGAPVPADTNEVLTYSYQAITELSTTDWEWETSDTIRDSIQITDDAWVTIQAKEQDLPVTNGNRAFDLAHFSIVKGTVEFTLKDGTANVPESEDPFRTEVPFKDGITELALTTMKVTEKVPALTVNGDIAFFNVSLPLVEGGDVLFSNTDLFKRRVEIGQFSLFGDYFVMDDGAEATYRLVGVYFPSALVGGYPDLPLSITGTIQYMYTLPNGRTTGLYSIDYANGIIYTQRPTLDEVSTPSVLPGGSPHVNDWSLKVNYQYTDYRAEYPIARLLPTEAYEINRTDRTIKIKDSEVLLRGKVSREIASVQRPYYQVNYDFVSETREKIEELKDFFTPVLKDYVIKVVTKGQLV